MVDLSSPSAADLTASQQSTLSATF
eukprot:COSAG01_NODE_30754_length_610_cov_0.812133_1_plen_24_part_10